MSSSIIIDKLTQEVTSFVLAPFKKAGVRNIRIYTFQIAMATGNLEMIKTVKELYGITPEEVRSIDVFECGTRPSKELVQWWVETCEPSKADLVKLFQRLCLCGGMADMARDLATQFNFTKDDLLSVNAILSACKRGDLELAKWMIETYDFTLDDIKNCNILKAACINPALLQYLISKFSFDRDYAIEAFCYACLHGDLDLVKTLANFFQITLSKYAKKNVVEEALDYCDDPHVREWLLDTYYKNITTN